VSEAVSKSTIVITGAALVTPLGLTRDQTWRAVLAGRCGMGPMPAMETPLPPQNTGGQAPDLPADFMPHEPREVRYLAWTIADALRDGRAFENLPYPSHRCGVMLGTTLHGMRSGGQFLRTGNAEPLRSFLASNTLARACAGFDLDGFAATTCSACSSSLGAIALAVTLLRAGQLDLLVAGGYDTISEYVYGGFNSLRLVAAGPLRPFARERQGMKLAEGYGIVILERANDANRRGAKALATVLGCGESADAHHLTQPHPVGDGAARAISEALRSSSLSAADIDLIAAHATGTPDNDAGEFAAFSAVFGPRLPHVPVVAFKSHVGHTLGGAGAVELILSAMALREQVIPPCANSCPEEIEFSGLNLSTGTAKPARLRATLNTSLGFGGANTAAILAPAQQPKAARASGSTELAEIRPSKLRDVLITGVGVITPRAVGGDAFIRQIAATTEPRWSADTGPIPESDYLHLLNARRVRRMSEYVKLTLAATALAMGDAKIEAAQEFAANCAVVLGSTHGSADFSATYYRQIVRQGFIGANPVLFAEGVPNAAAAHLSLMLGVKGACQTIIGSRTAGLDALHLASLRIASGEWDRAIVGAGEEYSTLVNSAYQHCGLHAGRIASPPSAGQGFVTGSGAVTLILESRDAAERRRAIARGQIIRGASFRGRPNESVESTLRVLEQLGETPAVLASLDGTWIDRTELAALRRAAPERIVSSLYGHTAEHFSAMPLLAIGAVLLNGKLPRLLEAARDLHGATGHENPERVAALCTDFSGCVTGVVFDPLVNATPHR
jgi:3-oxoacyl-[acyl-carrier-protein] synthase II